MGPVSTSYSATLNSDGSVTFKYTETFPANTFSAAELKAECANAKADADAEDVEFSCTDTSVSGTWTEEASDDEENRDALEAFKKQAQFVCDAMSGNVNFGEGDVDHDYDGPSPSSSASKEDKSSSSAAKEDCSFKMDDDTWSYGYYNAGLGGSMNKTYTISGNEYKAVYSVNGETLDMQTQSGEFSDTYTRKDMFEEAQYHCKTVNGLGGSSKDDDDEDGDDEDVESSSSSGNDYVISTDPESSSSSDLDDLLEEMEKISEDCTDGEKTTYMDTPMICKDGEWGPDLGELGIDLGSCEGFKKSDDVWTKTESIAGMEITETYKWIDATTVEYTSVMKGLESLAEPETMKDQNRDELYEEFCED